MKRPLDSSPSSPPPRAAPKAATAGTLDGAGVDREPKSSKVAASTISTSSPIKPVNKQCEDQEHWERTDRHRDIKEGQPRDDKYTYLKPVIRE